MKAINARLGTHEASVQEALAKVNAQDIIRRIWGRDHTIWQETPEEISNRLGWLDSPMAMRGEVDEINEFVEIVKKEGLEEVLLLGMGGSSLAPEVFQKSFGTAKGFLGLNVLDSTDPEAVLAHAKRLDFGKTLFIVATKSGGTVETLSFFKYFYNRVSAALGKEEAGKHFVAITDPGSKLAEIATQYGFRCTFENDADIGGRYSALSHFGLVPAALLGIDLNRLLDSADEMASRCRANARENPAAILGAAMGELAKAGRDKATFMLSKKLTSFGDWVEQLIAESTGKSGKGIVPVVGEEQVEAEYYGEDRFFVHIRLESDESSIERVSTLEEASHPIFEIVLNDTYDLGGQYFLWEMATAVAGHSLGIHPFNQPNVEAAKVLAKKMEQAYVETGELPKGETFPVGAGQLKDFLSRAKPGDYIALQTYIKPESETSTALQALRTRMQKKLKTATTVGYGPRFLHSTGQLHKGDRGNGLFIQFISPPDEDAGIPDEAGREESSITFGILKQAQALGDAQALREAGRRVISFAVDTNPASQIEALSEAFD